MNIISQITCVGMIMQRVRASVDNEKWMQIYETAVAPGEVQLFHPETIAKALVSLCNFSRLKLNIVLMV